MDIQEKKKYIYHECNVRSLPHESWNEAMRLAWRTFMEFESEDYTDEGIGNFRKFIGDDKLRQLFLLGVYEVYAAYVDDVIAGMISLRSGNHISLLFVDKRYQKCGIGTALIEYLSAQLIQRRVYSIITVDAAPYGIGFYHKLGFRDTETEQKRDGIKYTPMERKLNE